MSQIVLTGQQALALRGTAAQALKQTGRIEFGPGAVDPIIEVFSDSPYITRDNCEEIFSELITLFYAFKNETLDRIGDEALIRYMKKAFDGECCGSIELLESEALPALAKRIKLKYATPDLFSKEI
ncbi:putative uncharacterized protein [Firmicutes bacterium CAG:238]|nr:putative uncharacterized protein [Firmicutes bacterium CAG:238]